MFGDKPYKAPLRSLSDTPNLFRAGGLDLLMLARQMAEETDVRGAALQNSGHDWSETGVNQAAATAVRLSGQSESLAGDAREAADGPSAIQDPLGHKERELGAVDQDQGHSPTFVNGLLTPASLAATLAILETLPAVWSLRTGGEQGGSKTPVGEAWAQPSGGLESIAAEKVPNDYSGGASTPHANQTDLAKINVDLARSEYNDHASPRQNPTSTQAQLSDRGSEGSENHTGRGSPVHDLDGLDRNRPESTPNFLIGHSAPRASSELPASAGVHDLGSETNNSITRLLASFDQHSQRLSSFSANLSPSLPQMLPQEHGYQSVFSTSDLLLSEIKSIALPPVPIRAPEAELPPSTSVDGKLEAPVVALEPTTLADAASPAHVPVATTISGSDASVAGLAPVSGVAAAVAPQDSGLPTAEPPIVLGPIAADEPPSLTQPGGASVSRIDPTMPQDTPPAPEQVPDRHETAPISALLPGDRTDQSGPATPAATLAIEAGDLRQTGIVPPAVNLTHDVASKTSPDERGAQAQATHTQPEPTPASQVPIDDGPSVAERLAALGALGSQAEYLVVKVHQYSLPGPGVDANLGPMLLQLLQLGDRSGSALSSAYELTQHGSTPGATQPGGVLDDGIIDHASPSISDNLHPQDANKHLASQDDALKNIFDPYQSLFQHNHIPTDHHNVISDHNY